MEAALLLLLAFGLLWRAWGRGIARRVPRPGWTTELLGVTDPLAETLGSFLIVLGAVGLVASAVFGALGLLAGLIAGIAVAIYTALDRGELWLDREVAPDDRDAPLPGLRDVVGATARVTRPIPAGGRGAVAISYEDRLIGATATAEVDLPRGAPVVVTGHRGLLTVVAPATPPAVRAGGGTDPPPETFARSR